VQTDRNFQTQNSKMRHKQLIKIQTILLFDLILKIASPPKSFPSVIARLKAKFPGENLIAIDVDDKHLHRTQATKGVLHNLCNKSHDIWHIQDNC
jgi:hypothetical protein